MISLSAFIACVVVLSLCLIAFITAFTCVYILYKRVNPKHPASLPHISDSTETTNESHTASSSTAYEVPERRNETSSDRVYRQIQKGGGSGLHTLYGEQFVES